MKLSTLYTQVPDYLEYAWVCAPNAAGQSVSANTITTLTLDTEVVDAGGHGSIGSKQVTLAAGTYAFEASTFARPSGGFSSFAALLSLYNVSDSAYVTRGGLKLISAYNANPVGLGGTINGQLTISASKSFDLRLLSGAAVTVDNGYHTSALSTLSTAGADQRTTLKLWKLA
jgi:hypothetical protein